MAEDLEYIEMQTANIKMPLTTNDFANTNDNFDKGNYLDIEEETVRHLLSKKHFTIKQKMIKKLKGETPILHKKEQLCDLRIGMGKEPIEEIKQSNCLIDYLPMPIYEQSNYEVNCGSSCEFTCPICLEMFLTPCPTSCGHMFCYRCIDESVIRRSSCPSCRSNIRNEEFVESKPFSKMSDFFWSTSKEKESYYDKRLRNEEWMKGRKIDISNVKIEDFIDARDTEFIWCKAKIINIFNTNGKIEFLVHFLGWNEIYDEIIASTSQRLAPFKFFSDRDDIPKYRVNLDENNMRSRIDYPTSGDDESDSNNHVMVFGNRENFRRNHFQLMNPSRRPMIEELIARRRNFVPEFSLFNGVQNLFINLRPHRDESSSSNNVGEENINESSERLNEDERANEENVGVEEQEEDHIELDEESREGIHEVENFEVEIGPPNMNDSLNIPASNYYQLDEESVSNELVAINPSNVVNESDNYEIRREERSSSELEVIEIYQEEDNFRNLEVNQQRQTHNRLELEPSSESSSSYSFGCAPGEQ